MNLRIVSSPVVVAGFVLLVSLVTAAAPASAQQTPSASDIQAARVLFSKGVSLQESGKPGEVQQALDLFRRADSVYQAPTILLHLAECQAATGLLVESAETYQRLKNFPLPPNPSAPFIDAQKQGGAEMLQLEARIPQLQINVLPPNVVGLEVQVDGVPLNPALVGVSRAMNPVDHHIVANAPGYAQAESTVSLPERKKDAAVTLTLVPTAGGSGGHSFGSMPMPPPMTLSGGGITASGAKDDSRLGIIVGVRGGVNVLGGDVGIPVNQGPVGVGGSFGVEGGVRFAKHLYVGLDFEYASFLSSVDADTVTGEVTQSIHSEYYGADFAYLSNPLGLVGFYADAGLGYRVLDYSAKNTGGTTLFDDEIHLGGGELSLGIGATLRATGTPVLFVPKFLAGVGTFSDTGSSCDQGCATLNPPTSTQFHYSLLFALGAYFDKDL